MITASAALSRNPATAAPPIEPSATKSLIRICQPYQFRSCSNRAGVGGDGAGGDGDDAGGDGVDSVGGTVAGGAVAGGSTPGGAGGGGGNGSAACANSRLELSSRANEKLNPRARTPRLFTFATIPERAGPARDLFTGQG